jgi:tRNA threonylcarbamoyladenosine biosynthesis protein TsaE
MICDLNTIDNLIVDLKNRLENRDVVVLLQGDLASGKTTLVKKFVSHLGLEDLVTSPTFSLQSIYANQIFHYDLYNKGLDEFIALGMLEEFEKSGIHFVEWGDDKLMKLLNNYGYDVMVIEIEKKDNQRDYLIKEM